jgi:hypothetical protein
MSDDDKDDGYALAVGFSVPIKRVLEIDERPENPDGSRTGSMFMTIEGCTFEDGGLKGSAAATVGAPTVVVEIVEGKSSSRFVVSAHDIVQVAINAHKARMGKAEPADGSGGLQFHARRWNTGHSSTADLERAAIEFARAADPNAVSALRRLARLVWIQIGRMQNPLLNQVMSSGQADAVVNERFAAWNSTQVELGRALFHIVFRDGAPDLALINRALDFLES